MARKDFVKHNDPFTCKKCGAVNPPAAASERNHCRMCLSSLHLDKETPGDRVSPCGALMEPLMLDKRGKKGFMILNRCVNCGKEMWNRAADDDALEQLSLPRT